MADTEFSGELMELDSAVFNPCYSQVNKIVIDVVIPVVTDKTLVDYIVHGKDNMHQIFDVTIGDIPYHTEEIKPKKQKKECPEGRAYHYAPIPKWYTTKKWNEMQVAMSRKTPVTCSFSKNPDYKIIHTAPTPNRKNFTVIHIAPEALKSVVFKTSESSYSVVFEAPEPMIETIPMTYNKTSQIIYERDESRDNMEYDEAYMKVTGKVLSPFFGMHGMELIDAKLNYIGGFVDHDEDEAEEYDPLYGVDCIDETDAEVEHAKSMKAYSDRLLKAAYRVDEFKRENKLKEGCILSWSYKMTRAMTASGMMDGVDALNEYKATPNAFVFNEFEASECTEHYTVDEMNELAIHSIYIDDSTVMDDITGRNHYRATHWINSNIVETCKTKKAPVTFGASILNLVKPQPVRNGVNSKFPIATIISHEDTGYFGAPDMMIFKLSNTGGWLHSHQEKAVEMSADVKTIISVLTSEPKFIKEIGELVGMSETKVGKVLKTAAKAGLVKVVTVKNKTTQFRPRASYYI